MSRFLFALIFSCFAFSAYAGDPPPKLNPPIQGDMFKMTVLDKPVEISDIMLSGKKKGLVYLSEYQTKLVVLNVWATWCPPCVTELPSLNALQHAMGGNLFDVVTVSMDTTGPDSVQKYLDDNKLDVLPGFIDINHTIQQLDVLKGVAGIPVTLIINPQKRVIARVEGDVDWNGPAARAVIEYFAKNVSYSPI